MSRQEILMGRVNRTRQELLIAVVLVACCARRPVAALELVEVVKQIESAVVRIDTNTGFGSGAIVDDDGVVVTNFHVIDGASQVRITLRSGKPLEVLGFLEVDTGRDIAVLKTQKLADKYAIKITNTSPQVGAKVAAFGNPRGFDFTTSEGIVSAVRTGKQVVEVIGKDGYRHLGYDEAATWVQTTAAISPGNSGGPLVDMNAELVGLNTWCFTAGQNLNFAISASDIKTLLAKADDASAKGFAQLPRARARSRAPRPADRSPGDGYLKDFKVNLPSGRVFSFGAFRTELPSGRVASVENGNGYAVLKHANGSLYAAAGQVNGVLHGATVAQYDNREPMAFVQYADGKRHGVLRTFNEAGDPVFFAQYAKGKPHGFSCFFDEGDVRMIAEYHNGEEKWIQLMSGEHTLEGFSDRAAAEKNPDARSLLKKLDDVEESLKKNEVAFKKQVKDYNIRLRKVMSARVALAKRDQMLAAINKENADNAAFHSGLVRKAMTGR
jgi:S1-C subfamily serine protease